MADLDGIGKRARPAACDCLAHGMEDSKSIHASSIFFYSESIHHGLFILELIAIRLPCEQEQPCNLNQLSLHD
ncbi:hypothetical protein BRADI_3g00762v3 [Brachypodium distachyon]|uniref:Uncharacterized protein n=1 Tax=Brachypodium distachyon TaxID=15368 RepID=A0A2K2CUH4_BRADI|nr:hypothetical protein BRADI_3g00762v3 [Brachypodium distachyon]